MAAPGCTGTAVASIEDARVAANAAPGADRIEIGAGTFDGPLGAFIGGIEIAGAGPAVTVINGSKATQAINAPGASDTVHGLTVRLSSANAVGVDLTGGTVTDVNVDSTLADNPAQEGVILRGGGTAKHIAVTFPTGTVPVNYGIAVDGGSGGTPVPSTIEDVTLLAGYGIYVSQIAAPVQITRAMIHAGVYGIATRGDAHVTGAEIFAQVDGALDGGAGAHLADDYSTEPVSMELRHATLLSASPRGVGLGARSDIGQKIHVSLHDTVLDAHADVYARSIDLYGSTVTIDADHSAFAADHVEPAGLTFGAANQDTTVAPAHLTATGVPGPGSSLIDHASDLGGFDGDGDGVAVRDIGAVEAPAGTTPKSAILKASRRRIRGRSDAPTRLSLTRRHHGICQALRANGTLKKVAKAGRGCVPLFALRAPAGAWSVRLPAPLEPGTWTIRSRAARGGVREAHGDKQVLKVA